MYEQVHMFTNFSSQASLESSYGDNDGHVLAQENNIFNLFNRRTQQRGR